MRAREARVGEDAPVRLLPATLFWCFSGNVFVFRSVLVAVGTTAASATWLGVAATAALLTTLVIQVRWVEEPHLLETLGAEYRAYAHRTGRFIPGVGALSTAAADGDPGRGRRTDEGG